MRLKKNIFWILGAIALLGLDIATKLLAEKYLAQPVNVWPGVFLLFRSYNTGVAFGLQIPNAVMLFLVPVLTAAIAWLLVRKCNISHTATKFSLILMLCGSIGNYINRLAAGAVIDFLDFSFWPSFNFADAYLVTGVFIIIIFYGKIEK